MTNFQNKKILITGGTGSFGTAVLNRFLELGDFKEIRIFSRDEKKQDDLRQRIQDSRVKFYIGDVRDRYSVDDAMQGIDYVFHAAALKQIPSCEFFPMQAVKTNIIGTENVLNSAIQHGVKNVVIISTDKAAYPISVMGISKAMMEKVAIAKARSMDENYKTTISCTRYGNVMASRGSVIPLWIEQLKSGKEITITDPKMTRFMMSIDDAVNLVLYAFKNGQNGDLFIWKAPAAELPVIAQALGEVFEITPKIKIIGTRHGEKLTETLVTREEMIHAVDLGDYYRIPADIRDLNYNKYSNEGTKDTSNIEEFNSQNTQLLSLDEIKDLLLSLPEIQAELRETKNIL
ncbi:MAG: polysaccharide biosynthesis protein [Weeksellaceae bacterium]